MRYRFAVLAALLLAGTFSAPLAYAQDPVPTDSVQAWHGPQIAFAWPFPFNHVPQRFLKHAVRFTAPDLGTENTGLQGLDLVTVATSSSSQDGFNDTLRVLVAPPDEAGYPDEDAATLIAKPTTGSLVLGGSTRIVPEEAAADFTRGADFWVIFELDTVIVADVLAFASDGVEETPLYRSAAFVEDEGWLLMPETQFGRDYQFNVTARFASIVFTPREREEQPAATSLDVALYPNPAREQVRVAYRVPSGGPMDVRVYDLLGRRVATHEVATATAGTLTVPLRQQGRALAAGLYVVEVTAGAQRVQRLLVAQ